MKSQTWLPASRGDRRISGWFAILPVWIGNDFRWLEWVRVEWEYKEKEGLFPPCLPCLKWQMNRFVDDA